MGSYEVEQRKNAEAWAEAFAKLKELDHEVSEAQSRRDSQRRIVETVESKLKGYVGRNISKKLYKTEHGYVLVTHMDKTEPHHSDWATVELLDTI